MNKINVLFCIVLSLFSLNFCSASGWHKADDILSGNFSGNYEFRNSDVFLINSSFNIRSESSQFAMFESSVSPEFFIKESTNNLVARIGVPSNTGNIFNSGAVVGSLALRGANGVQIGGGVLGVPVITTDVNNNVGIGTITPAEKLEIIGNVKADNFLGKLNNYKMLSGFASFSYRSCGDTPSSPCIIDISSGGFSKSPACTLAMYNSDATAYVENMVIRSVSTTQLRIWKGNYQNEGTTMSLSWICVGK